MEVKRYWDNVKGLAYSAYCGQRLYDGSKRDFWSFVQATKKQGGIGWQWYDFVSWVRAAGWWVWGPFCLWFALFLFLRLPLLERYPVVYLLCFLVFELLLGFSLCLLVASAYFYRFSSGGWTRFLLLVVAILCFLVRRVSSYYEVLCWPGVVASFTPLAPGVIFFFCLAQRRSWWPRLAQASTVRHIYDVKESARDCKPEHCEVINKWLLEEGIGLKPGSGPDEKEELKDLKEGLRGLLDEIAPPAKRQGCH